MIFIGPLGGCLSLSLIDTGIKNRRTCEHTHIIDKHTYTHKQTHTQAQTDLHYKHTHTCMQKQGGSVFNPTREREGPASQHIKMTLHQPTSRQTDGQSGQQTWDTTPPLVRQTPGLVTTESPSFFSFGLELTQKLSSLPGTLPHHQQRA